MADIEAKGAIHSSPAASTSANDEISREASNADLDDNYELFKQFEGEEILPEESKRVLRKIDLRIETVLFVTYLLQYLDKNSINFASVYGLKEDTHLVGDDYSWLSSIFYFGYLIAQIPAGYLLQKLPLGRVISYTTIAWGMILLTTPACTSFAGIATNRFFLGLLESAISPGFVLIMSMWYTTPEQPLRLEAWYCTNGIATMFGGLIGYAVGHITTGALAQWMYVFLIFGSISTVWGLVSLFVLPDLPSTAKFLTPRERYVAVARVSRNRQGVKNRHFKKHQVIQTFTDPKTYILFIMAVGAQIPNSAITSFTSLILKTFGYDTLQTQYMQIPAGAIQFASLLGGGFICSYWPRVSRCAVMLVANAICILGSAMLVGLPESNKWGRLVALWLCYFQGLGFSMSLTMISSNVAGYTKKQLTAGLLFVGYCVGNIIGPQTFPSSGSDYTGAYIAMLVGYTVKFAAVAVLYVYMWMVNKKRDREQEALDAVAAARVGEVQLGEEDRAAVEAGMMDMTEIDNKGFRYVL